MIRGQDIAKDVILSFLNFDQPMTTGMTSVLLETLKKAASSAKAVLWITKGDLLHASKPIIASILGLFRTLRLEFFPTKFGLLDFDESATDPSSTSDAILCVLQEMTSKTYYEDECIFKNGLLYTSRFLPSYEQNKSIASKQHGELIQLPYKDLGPASLSIQRPNNFETLYMQQTTLRGALGDHEVEVEVKATGMNAKVAYQ